MFSEQTNQLKELTNQEQIELPHLVVAEDALDQLIDYVKEKDFKNVVLVADHNTYKACGHEVESRIKQEDRLIKTVYFEETEYQQVVADEATLVQLLIALEPENDLLLAVGSGTIHDVVRFASDKANIPFISVPTAASVDGFTSKGAPLILRGTKQTIQTASPIAVFADLNILIAAPKSLTAAGFGDILAKYTSLIDWFISAKIGAEPYVELAANMTRQSLLRCVEYVDQIAKQEKQGIELLMQSLLESGIVMLLLDYSRPASGGEHHLSHFWENSLISQRKKQPLHGEKTGVTTTIIVDLYRKFAKTFDPETLDESMPYKEKLLKYWPEIKQKIIDLPTKEELQQLLIKVDGPKDPSDLGIPESLVKEGLEQAHHLRDRLTALKLINLIKPVL